MDPHPAGAGRPRWSPLWLVLPLLWWEPVLGARSWGGGSSAPWAGPDAPWEQRLLDAEDLALALGPGGAPGTLPRDLPDLDPACRELLLDFARSSAELTGCLVRSARPVRICQACFPLFQQVVVKMDNISRAVENTSVSHNCDRSLLMSDRMQIVLILSEFFNSTWEKANCANCLTNTSDDLSNRTIYFLTLFNQTLTCFENNLQENSHSLLPLRNNSVCKNCLETYKSLSNLYNEMQKMNEREKKAEFGTHLCIDVEDAMNITRKLWSRTFNCSALCHDTVPVIAVSVFILFLPVVFYLSSYLHSEQKKRKLILPKRLKSSTSFASIQENSN